MGGRLSSTNRLSSQHQSRYPAFGKSFNLVDFRFLCAFIISISIPLSFDRLYDNDSEHSQLALALE